MSCAGNTPERVDVSPVRFVCGPTTGCGKSTPGVLTVGVYPQSWAAPERCMHCGRVMQPATSFMSFAVSSQMAVSCGLLANDLDRVAVTIGELNAARRSALELCALTSSELLIRWRQHCLTHKRFSPPDWETGEAGMLRELVTFALEVRS